ncbi:hypothetical protein EJB05_28128, partial [Eragrostis curvula]
MRRPLVSLQLVFLVCLFNLASATEQNIVTSLPGFDGVLPFRLETGYVTVDEDKGAELFYYFIQSEADPHSDPVLLWLTGGVRCSVFSSLALEIGPVRFIREPYNGSLPRLRYNPYSWTKAANILFVDSPVGAGYSFSRDPKGYDVGDVSSSLHLKTFLTKWFSDHPDFLTNPFYIGGDSYAGKIVPYLVQKLSEDIEAEVQPAINLKGYLVGNPATGERIDFESRVPYAHGVGIISDQLYETIMEHCRGEVYSKPINVICAQSLNRFNELLNEIATGHILYKTCIFSSPREDKEFAKRMILKEEIGGLKHPPPRPPMDCQFYGNYLSYFWANNNETRDALRIKK